MAIDHATEKSSPINKNNKQTETTHHKSSKQQSSFTPIIRKKELSNKTIYFNVKLDATKPAICNNKKKTK